MHSRLSPAYLSKREGEERERQTWMSIDSQPQASLPPYTNKLAHFTTTAWRRLSQVREKKELVQARGKLDDNWHQSSSTSLQIRPTWSFNNNLYLSSIQLSSSRKLLIDSIVTIREDELKNKTVSIRFDDDDDAAATAADASVELLTKTTETATSQR